MTKKELRIKYKALRNSLTDEEVEDKSLAIANRLLELDIWDKTYFHLFLSIEEHKEIQTEYILQILTGKDKEVIISKSDFESCSMEHYLLTDNTRLKKNEYGIPEPADGIQVPDNKIDGVFPEWFPIWGGEPFSFFNAIFNVADAAISVGVIILILFNKKAFAKPN